MVWLLVITLKQILNKKRASRCLSHLSIDVKRYNDQDNFEKKRVYWCLQLQRVSPGLSRWGTWLQAGIVIEQLLRAYILMHKTG